MDIDAYSSYANAIANAIQQAETASTTDELASALSRGLRHLLATHPDRDRATLAVMYDISQVLNIDVVSETMH